MPRRSVLRRSRRFPGFTIIELMVVVAIIVLLIAILLPSLSEARQHAKTVVCASNLHHIGLATANYLYSSNATYPASYLYPHDEYGSWSVDTQTEDHPFGYMHWSYFMYSSGKVGEQAFQCPNYDHGGVPRTNPGLKADDWESGQVDQTGDGKPNELEDKQAPRMTYAANAAIMPRNKFTRDLSGGQRVNVFVREQNFKRPGDTILATEYVNNWKALGIRTGGGVLVKSHRPINPFYHVGSGFNEYNSSERNPGFIYGLPDDQDTYGLLPTREIQNKVNILDHSSGMSQINAIGRHHPTTDPLYRERFGGAANFLFADAHAETMTVLQTMRQRKWGDAYYGISGERQILNMTTVNTGGGRP